MSTEKEMTEAQIVAYNEFLQHAESQIDPRDYFPPSLKEIAKLSIAQLDLEYSEVINKVSNRGRTQRDFIVSRWEYEKTISEPNAPIQ